MWFKRKQKNRRFDRPKLLDVKLRSSQTRAARFRLAGLGLSVSFALIVILFVLWRGGEWVLNRLVYENEAFAIQQIEVQTDGVIAPDHFRRWSMVKSGQNLLALDLVRVKRDMELVPLIQSATVERILPRTLRIRIVEREPVAQVTTMQRSVQGQFEPVIYHLDESGFVFLPLDPRLRAAPATISPDWLPTVSGVNLGDLRPGRRVESAQVRAALQLITEFDHSPMAGLADLRRINVAAPEILEAYTGQGSHVVFSLNDFTMQFRRWRLIHDEYHKMGKAIAMLDLSIANNLPLRYVETSSLPPVPTKAVKPQKTKRKNV